MASDVSSFNNALGAFNDAMGTLSSMQDEFAEFSANMDKETAASYHILAQSDRKYYQMKARIAKNSRLQVRKDELNEAKQTQAKLMAEEQENRKLIEKKKQEIKQKGTSASKKLELEAARAERDAYLQMLKEKEAKFLEIESTLSGQQLEEVRARNSAELAEMVAHGAELADKVTSAEIAVEEALEREAEKKSLQRKQKAKEREVREATAKAEECAQAVADCEQSIRERTFNAIKNAQEVMFREATAKEKAEILTERAQNYRKQTELAKEAYEERVLQIYSEVDDVAEANRLIAEAAKERDDRIRESNAKAQADETAALEMRQAANMRYFSKIKEAGEGAKGLDKFKEVGKAIIDFELHGADQLMQMAETQKQLAKDAQKNAADTRKAYLDVKDDPNISDDEKKEKYDAYLKAAEASNKANAAALAYSVGEAVTKAVNKSMEDAERIIQENGAHIEARLQGSGITYNGVLGIGGILNNVSSMLSVNPLVKTENVLKAIRDASDAGVAYNLQGRALLSELADKIANTFDAFDSNLLRLIRLQQADTTAARLGMEAELTQFFNSNFQDTSYLKDTRNSVSSTLIDANASMSRDMSAEFEYTVHKWLGSLSSLGMSDEGVNEIAKGLNMLATGDVEGLASNTELQTMFAMAASEAGLEYSELLLNGLDPSSTNKLLSSMVSYLKRIAEGSDNQVVRSAYGDVFNLSMSDMKAISNMTANDISKISAQNMAYSQMNAETLDQIILAGTRTHMGEMLKNVYDNAVFSVGVDMVSNPVTYSMWKMLDYMDENSIDFEIPFVNVHGFGLHLNTSVQQIMKMGLGAAGAASLVGNILSGIATGGGIANIASNMLLGEYTRHGEGMVFANGEAMNNSATLDILNNTVSVSTSGDTNSYGAGDSGESTSSATYVATGNNQDMQNSTLNSATDDAEETAEITNKNSETGFTIDDFYKVTVDGEEGSGKQRTEDIRIKEVYLSDSNWLAIRDARMSFTGNNYSDSLRVHDSYLYSVLSPKGVVSGTGNAIRSIVHMEAGESLAVKIVAASNSKEAAVQVKGTVYLEDSTINKLANKIAGTDDTDPMKSKAKTVGDLYRLFSGEDTGARAHVRVQNEDGSRLQVDTEDPNGFNGYDSGWMESLGKDAEKLVW